MEYALDIGLCLMEAFSITFALDSRFHRRFSSDAVQFFLVLCFSLFVSISTILVFASSLSSFKIIFAVFSYLFLVMLLYQEKLAAALLAVVVYIAVLYTIDYMVAVVVMGFFRYSYPMLVELQSVYFLSAFTAKTLLAVLAALWAKFERRKKSSTGYLPVTSWFVLLLIAVFSIFIMVLMVNQAIKRNELSVWVFVLCFGLWACDVAVIFLWNRLEREGQIIMENKLLRQEIQSNLEKASALEQAYRRQRRQTHDFNNHMKAVQGLLTIGKTQEALQYVQQWTKEEAPGRMAIESGNPLVDTVLTQKYLEAKEKGVHMMFLLEDAAALPVSDAEFITVLTNLLDNAARAAAECAQEKEVRVKFKRLADGGCLLSVRNTSNPVTIEADTIQTTKQNAHAHGFGIVNVKRVAEKHGGTCSLSQKDGWVQFTVLLPVSHKIS